MLAGRGARLTLLCRDRVRGDAVAEEISAIGDGSKPRLLIADLGDLQSVRRAAEEFQASGETLDVLLNNAGLINTSRRESIDGFEETFAVNHLGPFLLTGLLLPQILKGPAGRIVNVSSNAHAFCRGMQFDDLQSEEQYRTFNAYGRSKLANILFTRELARRLHGRGVTVNCLHPGAVATNLGVNNGGLLGKILPALLKPFFRTPEQGAETAVYLCEDAAVAGVTGKYFVDCRDLEPKPWARDDAAASKLWDLSERMTSFHYNLEEAPAHGV
jgi:NAD(P)-dependent dehydrogenase (short-subunit alcohol dehydrogenase family)